MNNPYSAEQGKWLNELNERYRAVTDGVCMVAIRSRDERSAGPCKGPIGFRHAIARRHLRLIADDGDRIRANKEVGTFAVWPEKYDDLRLVPISRFSAGKWACQKHDLRFEGIDAERIDLAKPENLFKAVYRVVLRHNHLTLARWNAHFTNTKTEEGWTKFKEISFNTEVTDEEAVNAENIWRKQAHAVMEKMCDLEQRLARQEWNSLEYRAVLLESRPSVAGWGCMSKKFNVSGIHPDDPRRYWGQHIELGYMVVIPQQDGHAIITACEPDTRVRVPEIASIHNYIPRPANPNEPYRVDKRLSLLISGKLWGLNEIGMRESLFQSWSTTKQRGVQAWMKNRGSCQSSLFSPGKTHLPRFF